MRIFAHEPLGCDGFLIHVEADIRAGIPAVEIVGLASAAVREARERVRVAVRKSGFVFPSDRIVLNLAPGDVPKEGTAYDLPLALKILSESLQIADPGVPLLALGELTLEGEVRPVRGILPAVRAAVRAGIATCIVPEANAEEAAVIDSLAVWPLEHLSRIGEVITSIKEGKQPPLAGRVSCRAGGCAPAGHHGSCAPDFSDYRGDPAVLRAFEVAAAGGHHLLLAGPPGAGKTMGACRFSSLLPDLDEEEALEAASIYSLAGMHRGEEWHRPPFRTPHHSATLEGMLGGARPLKPGEASLAHHGVLFLDETPEFRRDILQALREPVERGYVDLARAGMMLRFPSEFQLLMAANPCPCGNLGLRSRTCVCSPDEIRRYWKRLGGALLDRIDIRCAVTPPDASRLLDVSTLDPAILRARIAEARRLQRDRCKHEGSFLNARMPPARIAALCELLPEARRLLAAAVTGFGLSARASHAVLKVSRTIADLEGKTAIDSAAIEEALSYRQVGEMDAVWGE